MAGGLNLYLYVGNDPINRADPLGLWWKTALTVLAAVAAVVVLTAPISGPLLLVAAGVAAGMVNEALNQETFCLSCILLAGLKGAAMGAIATVPFLFLPAAAGYAAFAGAGALSGFIGYAADWAMTPGAEWSWKSAAIATGLGAALGPVTKFIGGRIAAPRPVSSAPAEPVAPPAATGETPATATGKSVHAELAAGRRASGDFDLVNQPLVNAEDEAIQVPSV